MFVWACGAIGVYDASRGGRGRQAAMLLKLLCASAAHGSPACAGDHADLVTFSLALLENFIFKIKQRVFVWACGAVGAYDASRGGRDRQWTQDGFPHLGQTRITLPQVRQSLIHEENHWNSRSTNTCTRLRSLWIPVVLEIQLVQA